MDDILVGIDFGTTNSVITYFSDNKANVLYDGIFKNIPSKVGKVNDKYYCGNYIPINCENVYHSFKMSINNSQSNDLLIIFFKHLYDIISKHFKITKQKIKAVITVPSNFNDSQREIIKNSFTSVNIKVIRIINEPSAAALAYGLNYSSTSEEKILVIDTGGGTMDFTVLEKTELFFEVIHSEGLNDLGGNNFTQIIFNDILKSNQLVNYDNIILWNQSQNIKEKLSYLESYEINNKINYILTRNKFENLSNQFIEKINNVLDNIIKKFQDITYIILVGGTSKIPFLQDTFYKITQKKPWVHPHLDTVVAEGAGLYAGIIENKFTNNNDVVLLDVLPLSLGVELADGSYSIIIPKNTPLPIKRSNKYTTDSPTESNIKINVYQGERKIANKNHLIGSFTFDKVSLGGVPIIEISFKVDLNSIISVNILDRKSGCEKNIVIKNILDVNSEQVDKLIQQSIDLEDVDNLELSRNQNIYIIKNHIENSLINLQINDNIPDKNKKEILDYFKKIEENIDEMNNLELVEIIKCLNDNYSIIGTNKIESFENDQFTNIEKLFINDKKLELKNRINILIVKNPEWNEYLEPVLKQLEYNNISIEYINEKLLLLDELEKDKEDIDYKQEVNNLCLYLKMEIDNGNINLEDNNKLLIELINDTFNLLNNNDINWQEHLNILNKKCEEIYNFNDFKNI